MDSSYIVSARKYRPSTFRTVVGQQALTHTLKSVIDSGKLAHAYLFCGPRGVGKTSCARIFAKTINCLSKTPEGEACNQCESCQAFNEQRSYNIVELDAASNNSVDDIRNLIEQVRIPPQFGKYRVFIIDEVHMLSQAAFNAFLKTLEEPPAHAIFILATTEKHKIIPTILSRCQIYDFNRITINDIVGQLQYIAQQENISAESAALNVIAQKADGAMRDALSIFDQVAASCEGNITYQGTIANLNVLDHDYYFRLIDTFLAGDVPQALLIYKDIRDHGFDSQFFVNGLANHLRNLMVASTPSTKCLLEMSDEVAELFVAQAAKLSARFLYLAMDLCNTCDMNYRTASNKQFLVELTLIKICQLMSAPLPPNGGGGGTPLKKVTATAAPAQAPAAAAPQYNATPRAEAATTPVASAPVAAPATPAPQRPAMPARPRILISPEARAAEAQRQAQNAAPVAAESAETPNLPFTHAQLLAAWDTFIAAHQKDPLIANTMRMFKPYMTSENTFEIEIERSQFPIVEQYRADILRHLHTSLSNHAITFTVKEHIGESTFKIWSPREIIQDLRTRYPKVETLIKDYKLSLA